MNILKKKTEVRINKVVETATKTTLELGKRGYNWSSSLVPAKKDIGKNHQQPLRKVSSYISKTSAPKITSMGIVGNYVAGQTQGAGAGSCKEVVNCDSKNENVDMNETNDLKSFVIDGGNNSVISNLSDF